MECKSQQYMSAKLPTMHATCINLIFVWPPDQTFIHYSDLQIGRAVQHFQHPMQLAWLQRCQQSYAIFLQVSNAFRVPRSTTECWCPHPVTGIVYIWQRHMTMKQSTCACVSVHVKLICWTSAWIMTVLWPRHDNHWSLYGWMLLLLMLSVRLQLSLQVVCVDHKLKYTCNVAS